eukprot:763914-Hanusia_phi.AAC.6
MTCKRQSEGEPIGTSANPHDLSYQRCVVAPSTRSTCFHVHSYPGVPKEEIGAAGEEQAVLRLHGGSLCHVPYQHSECSRRVGELISDIVWSLGALGLTHVCSSRASR